jgi:ribonucleotide monophosphatase NagD (HAD superfamily)
MGDARYFRDKDGLSLDIGPFVAALEYATGSKGVVLGKPAAEFFNSAVERLGCLAGEVVMVGDSRPKQKGGRLLWCTHCLC